MDWEFGGSSPGSERDQQDFMFDNMENVDFSMMSNIERHSSGGSSGAAMHEAISPTTFDLPNTFDAQYLTSLTTQNSNTELDQLLYNYSLASSDTDSGEAFSWPSNSETPGLEETFSQFMMTGDNTPTMPATPGGASSKTTLVLEDVDAVTLSQVIAILTERNTKMKMESGVSQLPSHANSLYPNLFLETRLHLEV
jgi:hypothetical protein